MFNEHEIPDGEKVLVPAPAHTRCMRATHDMPPHFPERVYFLAWKIGEDYFFSWLCPVCDDMWLQ